MKHPKSIRAKSIAALSLLLSVASGNLANAYGDTRQPEVPVGLTVPAGNKVSFHAYAEGVQIYKATPSRDDPTKLVWTFAAPEAVLFDTDGVIVGIHYAYAGPTYPAWESESGSKVVATRTVPPVVVDPTAIAWLRLDMVQTIGPGIFNRTTFIQRVNTTGGLAPVAPPTYLGQEARIPYTAEYYFFRAEL
jgi:hypothetical protein